MTLGDQNGMVTTMMLIMESEVAEVEAEEVQEVEDDPIMIPIFKKISEFC